jgi:hypothetical protein
VGSIVSGAYEETPKCEVERPETRVVELSRRFFSHEVNEKKSEGQIFLSLPVRESGATGSSAPKSSGVAACVFTPGEYILEEISNIMSSDCSSSS